MKNLVEKFTPQTTEIDDDGIVAIEYVLVAAAVAAALGAGVFTGAFGAITQRLTDIINGV